MVNDSHISDPDLTSFCSGLLSAEDTIMTAEHLEICPECSLRFKNHLKSASYCQPIIFDFSPMTYLADEHLGYEQLSDYLAGVLDEDDTEIINIHVELCADCRMLVGNSLS